LNQWKQNAVITNNKMLSSARCQVNSKKSGTISKEKAEMMSMMHS